MLSRRLKLRIGSTVGIAFAALSLGSASAHAGVLVASAPACGLQPLFKPFTPWLDYMQYTPLAGGDFESPVHGWKLSGGSRVMAGNEPFQVSGPGDLRSLTVPPGGSATSPTICVGIGHPTMRFFAKRTSGGLLNRSTLRVDVLFENAAGAVQSQPIGVVPGVGGWQPTLPLPVLANLLPLLPGDHTPVAFRFTPILGGSWSIDDVHVDPYQRR